jgi:hypothetical protein
MFHTQAPTDCYSNVDNVTWGENGENQNEIQVIDKFGVEVTYTSTQGRYSLQKLLSRQLV